MKRRPLSAEKLETRQLLASENPWHNAAIPQDVTDDGQTTAIDALVVLNNINRNGGPITPLPESAPVDAAMIDVNDDGQATTSDALYVINRLMAEGESAIPVVNTVDTTPSVIPGTPSVVGGNFRAMVNEAESLGPQNLLTSADVETLLNRAVLASHSNDAVIAVVDRGGRILGVRVESGVDANVLNNADTLAFAIDGAVSKARSSAFFSSNDAPLTSRTVRFISQSTMTQREVESSPLNTEDNYRGPGFVAPIGVGGGFPPEVPFTPQVDLFAIEHIWRDSKVNPGLDAVKGSDDDFTLHRRFNVNAARIPPAVATTFSTNPGVASVDVSGATDALFQTWPESYGFVSGTSPTSQARGIGTLPGGVPLYKTVVNPDGTPVPGLKVSDSINLVGAIGVFFPGENGFATHEQGFIHTSDLGRTQTERERTNASKVLEAEYIALIAAAGGTIFSPDPIFARDVQRFNNSSSLKDYPLPRFIVPNGRIDLVGITLEIFGPTPNRSNTNRGIDQLLQLGDTKIGLADATDLGITMRVDTPVTLPGSFIVGTEYRIVTPGTTDFTALGAADNNVGTVFTATGAGTGTGTAIQTEAAGAFTVGVEYQIATPGTTDFTALGAADNNVGTVFTATGAGSGTGTASRTPLNYLPGQSVPYGWLIAPTASADGLISAAEVERIIKQGIEASEITRSAVRLNLDNRGKAGEFASTIQVVVDKDGNILGFYRMKDSLTDAIDVTVAKARNAAYYADSEDVVPVDRPDFNADGTRDVEAGVAFTGRTHRLLVGPRYPTGLELSPQAKAQFQNLANDQTLTLCDQAATGCLEVGPQSTLRMPGINPLTAENIDNANPLPDSVYKDPNSQSPLAFVAFNPGRNFRDPGDATVTIQGTGVAQPLANQNGGIFFPGTSPLYNATGTLIAGLGVSGDGVDQNDVVTSFTQDGFIADGLIRADQFIVGGVRLPFLKFNRNPQ